MITLAYPKVEYPTIKAGWIDSIWLRCETLGGGEIMIKPEEFGSPKTLWRTPDGGISLKDFGPFVVDGVTYAVPHQQKYSWEGWLLADPWCRHWWRFSKRQEQDASGGWIPGSEVGKYYRLGNWRWDPAGTRGKHWMGPITVYANFSSHWD